MKPSSYLIIVCRGGVINQKYLYNALKENWIAGAAIYVAEKEPINKDCNLCQIDNLIITPRASWYSIESYNTLKRETARNIAVVLQRKTPRNIANKDVL